MGSYFPNNALYSETVDQTNTHMKTMIRIEPSCLQKLKSGMRLFLRVHFAPFLRLRFHSAPFLEVGSNHRPSG
jgi:hypothetical protein